jgi:hypothetical protein
MTPHLTEDQLDDLLIGTGSVEAAQHLASCPACQGRRDGFLQSMVPFNQASQAWSEARSNALNRDLTGHRTPFRITRAAAWTCASLLVVFLAGLAEIDLRRQPAQSLTASVQSIPATEERNQEIASDNAMLYAIDAAISAPEPSPAQLYGNLSSVSNHRERRGQVQN